MYRLLSFYLHQVSSSLRGQLSDREAHTQKQGMIPDWQPTQSSIPKRWDQKSFFFFLMQSSQFPYQKINFIAKDFFRLSPFHLKICLTLFGVHYFLIPLFTGRKAIDLGVSSVKELPYVTLPQRMFRENVSGSEFPFLLILSSPSCCIHLGQYYTRASIINVNHVCVREMSLLYLQPATLQNYF